MTDVKLRFDKLEHTFNKIGLDACLNDAKNDQENIFCKKLEIERSLYHLKMDRLGYSLVPHDDFTSGYVEGIDKAWEKIQVVMYHNK